jgi:phosphatidylserine/phosphatidylglycerophosphate/cardiolipin synthase-like enzyme
MKITPYAIQNLREIITGDKGLTPSLSGRQLVAFFNSFGIRDVYNGALPDGLSRKNYAENRLGLINNSSNLANLLEELVSERHFNSTNLKRETAVEEINKLIKPDGFYISFLGGKYKIGGNIEEPIEEINNKVHFEDIQGQILAELDNAKYTIWIAVAWFTDPVLFKKLIQKNAQGVNIQVLIMDDDINRNGGLKFEDYFETKRVPKTGYFENITHHKFCVIDLHKIINGSYNWTIKAQYNEENITISSDRESAKKFADRFMLIKTKGK